jgi:hypothetical protein
LETRNLDARRTAQHGSAARSMLPDQRQRADPLSGQDREGVRDRRRNRRHTDLADTTGSASLGTISMWSARGISWIHATR